MIPTRISHLDVLLINHRAAVEKIITNACSKLDDMKRDIWDKQYAYIQIGAPLCIDSRGDLRQCDQDDGDKPIGYVIDREVGHADVNFGSITARIKIG